jgi:hypothetical protein
MHSLLLSIQGIFEPFHSFLRRGYDVELFPFNPEFATYFIFIPEKA